ncbi:hypothetical protein LCGC14_2702250 [marine sediment metagenome]|uniref:Uncharacterized protein n=1 Tax=marine sediment metagenome TaxID=412755 RepID=A0A0F8ZFC1_9ZZZZ
MYKIIILIGTFISFALLLFLFNRTSDANSNASMSRFTKIIFSVAYLLFWTVSLWVYSDFSFLEALLRTSMFFGICLGVIYAGRVKELYQSRKDN